MRKKDYVLIGDGIVDGVTMTILSLAVIGTLWASYKSIKESLPNNQLIMMATRHQTRPVVYSQNER